jgi:hypothetical protein
MWSAVSSVWSDTSPFVPERLDDEEHFVGGAVVGMHLLPSGSACMVVWGYFYQKPWDTLPNPWSVRLVIVPPDGKPDDARWNNAYVVPLSERGTGAYPLATCRLANGSVAVLIRTETMGHELCIFNGAVVTRRTVANGLLSYGTLMPPGITGSVIIAPRILDYAVASSNGTHVRFVMSIEEDFDIDLAGNNLPGLVRLELKTLRFEADAPVLGMTAYLDHPGIGATSVGVILRLRADGTRDATFGANGLWVSPLNPMFRGFLCAGEFGGVLAGAIGHRAVLFGPDRNDPGGNALDFAFGGGNGYAERDLGGPLGQPVAIADAQAIYVYAQRVPAPADPGDMRGVGCRFASSGVPDQGFGAAGVSTVWCDDIVFEPKALAVSGSRLFLSGTRELRGEDCDRSPVVIAMNAANGDPVPDYGFGGFSLHGSIAAPAYIAPDGASVFAERTKTAGPPVLRFVSANGETGARVTLTPIAQGGRILSIVGLADGSLLITGGRTSMTEPAWVLKLTPGRTIDAAFGANGVFRPRMEADLIWALGVRPDNAVVLQLNTAAAAELAVMRPAGALDTAFGTMGFVEMKGFTHAALNISESSLTCFLDDDGSVLCVAHSGHNPDSQFSQFVHVGLRRIMTDGAYDPAFGLGVFSAATPPSNMMATLISPHGGTLDYSGLSPRAIWRAGGKIYLFATGFAGGGFVVNRPKPRYPVFMVFRWNADGSRDNTFSANGVQEAGYDPDHIYWSCAGVLKYSADTAIVYGMAGAADIETHSVGDTSYNVTIVREPKPALFKFDHDTGLDFSFGEDGAARYPLWEVLLSPVAGALLADGRARIACVDVLGQQRSDRPMSNLAGLIQWRLADIVGSPL